MKLDDKSNTGLVLSSKCGVLIFLKSPAKLISRYGFKCCRQPQYIPHTQHSVSVAQPNLVHLTPPLVSEKGAGLFAVALQQQCTEKTKAPYLALGHQIDTFNIVQPHKKNTHWKKSCVSVVCSCVCDSVCFVFSFVFVGPPIQWSLQNTAE